MKSYKFSSFKSASGRQSSVSGSKMNNNYNCDYTLRSNRQVVISMSTLFFEYSILFYNFRIVIIISVVKEETEREGEKEKSGADDYRFLFMSHPSVSVK